MDTSHVPEIVRDSLEKVQERNQWSDAEMARQLGVHRVTVWRWKNDKIDDSVKRLIAAVLTARADAPAS